VRVNTLLTALATVVNQLLAEMVEVAIVVLIAKEKMLF